MSEPDPYTLEGSKHFPVKYLETFKRRLSVVDSPKVKKELRNEDRISTESPSNSPFVPKKSRDRVASSDGLWGKITPKAINPKVSLGKLSKEDNLREDQNFELVSTTDGNFPETTHESASSEEKPRVRSGSNWVYGQVGQTKSSLEPNNIPKSELGTSGTFSPRGPFLRPQKTSSETDSSSTTSTSSPHRSRSSSAQHSGPSSLNSQQIEEIDLNSIRILNPVQDYPDSDLLKLQSLVTDPPKEIEEQDSDSNGDSDSNSNFETMPVDSQKMTDGDAKPQVTDDVDLLVPSTTNPPDINTINIAKPTPPIPSVSGKPKLKPRSQLRSEMIPDSQNPLRVRKSAPRTKIETDLIIPQQTENYVPFTPGKPTKNPGAVLKHHPSRLRQLPLPEQDMIGHVHPSLIDKMKSTIKDQKASRPDITKMDFTEKADARERRKQFRRSKSVPSIVVADILNQKDGEEKVIEWKRKGVIYKVLPSGTKLLKAGTLARLVEWMTTSDAVDPGYVPIFLLTYRAFSEPRVFFEHIRQIYWETCADQKNIQYLEKTRTRIFHVLRKWLSTYIYDLEDERELIQDILGFLETISPESMLSVLQSIQRSLEKHTSRMKSKKIDGDNLSSVDVETPSKINLTFDTSWLNFCYLDNRVIAQQLTILHHRLYKSIQGQEFIFNLWSKKKEKANNLAASVDRFNLLAQWVSTEILRPNQPIPQAQIVEKWIHIAKLCDEFQNMSDVIAILAGLHSVSVWRLKGLFQKISPILIQQLDEMEQAYSHENNFKALRDMMKSKPTPMIPYLGMFTKDILFIEEGNPTFLRDDVINFDKFRMLGNLIIEIQTYQQGFYPWPEAAPLQQYLITLEVFDEATSMKLSYEQQPRRPRPQLEESISTPVLNPTVGTTPQRVASERQFTLDPSRSSQHLRTPSPHSVRSTSSDVPSEASSFVPSSLSSLVSSSASEGEHDDDFGP